MGNDIINFDEKDELLMVINDYSEALDLLDNYDHQCLKKPVGNKDLYQITYSDCRELIDKMRFSSESNLFGVEKEKGKLNGILAAIYQSAFGKDAYESLEEKAAHLLYFLVKDHPFVDGCKRIGAAIFLMFLYKNNALIKNGEKRLSNSALVAITLLIAQSNPDEKEIMIKLLMNIL